MKRHLLAHALVFTALAAALVLAPRPTSAATAGGSPPAHSPIKKLALTEAEWKQRLSPEEFRVLRKKGTERAFTGKYWNNHARGVYRCAGCGLELFPSETKFDSGTGWPSFWKPIAQDHVVVSRDVGLGMVRDEVTCARCGGHLGHVFDDGPEPTHLRYCMNSASLAFQPAK